MCVVLIADFVCLFVSSIVGAGVCLVGQPSQPTTALIPRRAFQEVCVCVCVCMLLINFEIS